MENIRNIICLIVGISYILFGFLLLSDSFVNSSLVYLSILPMLFIVCAIGYKEIIKRTRPDLHRILFDERTMRWVLYLIVLSYLITVIPIFIYINAASPILGIFYFYKGNIISSIIHIGIGIPLILFALPDWFMKDD